MENRSLSAYPGSIWNMTFDTYNEAARKREGFAPLIALDRKQATFGLQPRRDAVVMLYYLIMIQGLDVPAFAYDDGKGLVPIGLTCHFLEE